MQVATENITTLETPVVQVLTLQEENFVNFLSEVIVNSSIQSTKNEKST